MTSKKSAGKTQKPLATVGSNPRVEIYRAKLHPFESTKYLNATALKKAAKANIEVGRVEGGGAEVTIVAELHHGAVKRIRTLACKGCTERATATRKGGRGTKAASKKLLRQALLRIQELGPPVVTTKVPIGHVDLEIPIGPIIIYIDGHGIDVCISYGTDDGWTCISCLGGLTFCIGPVVLN